MDKSNENKTIAYSCNGKFITFNRALIMAIVNATPDSFYDGGKYDTTIDVIKDVEDKLQQGADIIDIGAASTRPNAPEINEEEEWNRLQKVLLSLRKEFPNALLSVDTYRSGIAQKSADAGVDIINDISGGNFDVKMFEMVAKLNLPYILTHIKGTPQTMQLEPIYTNIITEIKTEFEIKIKALKKLNFDKLILDSGFGFGKSTAHNYQLLKEL
jgi:dihydropteroate synthase